MFTFCWNQDFPCISKQKSKHTFILYIVILQVFFLAVFLRFEWVRTPSLYRLHGKCIRWADCSEISPLRIKPTARNLYKTKVHTTVPLSNQYGCRTPSGGIAQNQVIARSELDVHHCQIYTEQM